MDEFKESVRRGFSACKDDINVLKEENLELKENNSKLSNDISNLSNEIKDLKEMINSMKEMIIESNSKKEVETSHDDLMNQIHEDLVPKTKKIEKKEVKEKDPYEALLQFKAKANKREMLKQKLVSMIGEAGMNLSELKFMFVEHFKYCSKATFYNYLKELEIEKTIRIERENSKNFVYLSAVRKEI